METAGPRPHARRIAGIECLNLSRLHDRSEQWATDGFRAVKADATIVRVVADDGSYGIGEACPYGHPPSIARWVERASAWVAGMTIDAALGWVRPNGLTWSFDAAMGAIDCALWDLRGRHAGMPVARLLGAEGPLETGVYASSGVRYDWRIRPEQVIDEALAAIDDGHQAFKLRIGTRWAWEGITADRFLGLMGDLVEAVDGRMRLMLDANGRLGRDEALAVARGIERLGFAWFEEPIDDHDLDGYRQLAAAVGIPISGGEKFRTVEQFAPYLERGALDIVQPDIAWTGISEGLRIADLAARHGVPVVPHSWHNGLMIYETAHFVAALGARAPQGLVEVCMVQGPLQAAVLRDPLAIVSGRLVLDDGPGFGVELADDLPELFPYIDGDYATVVTPASA